MPQTRSKGWQLTLTHPTTGRTISPDVLDNPEFDPSLNSLVTARIPVRKSEDLLEWPSGTEVELRLDGREQPLDEVVDFEQESDRTIIVAEGGLELDNRVRTEYQEERRHIAAAEIIEQETPYAADVDTPQTATQEGVVLQEATTTEEFEELLIEEIPSTEPINISNNEVTAYDTGFVIEGENADSINQTFGSDTDDVFSGGEAEAFAGQGDGVEFNFTTEYTIPAGECILAVRQRSTADEGTSAEDRHIGQFYFDNDAVGARFAFATIDNINWYTITLDFEVSAGTHTFGVEIDEDGGAEAGDAQVDVMAAVDSRQNPVFDNEVHEPSGYLDGPETKPKTVELEFGDATTPFTFTQATSSLAIDNTDEEQSISLSIDRGGNFETSNNTDSITLEDIITPTVRTRFTLSNYSSEGAREQTPRFGYDFQIVSSYELAVDISQESLLIDQTYDNNVESVLNEIAGDEYIWSYRLENGTPTVAWSQPGQREASSDPDIDAEVRVSKNIKTWDAVTIKGSSQSVSGERFDGSTTYQSLNRENIVPGSESVSELDGDTDFRRGEDYEMRYNDGEIRILGSGDMDGGTEYEIDYRFEVEGTHPPDYEGSNELVETISGVVSDRQAQQLAYTILEIDPGVRFPSYSADVLLPRGDLFDPLEALSLEQLQLPEEATPIEIREQPQRTPQGLSLRLGAKDPLSGLNRLSNQLQSVSRRS